ncbi:MAG: GerW family sporulation protein [Oscillospiraceae bacterium]|jgi:sporulation protein YtfJ|nr:GerW family sporulation protein [Oscillospiraceae bacterium]
MEHPISALMETTMEKIRGMVDANTIIGEQIVTRDGVTIIPVSKVTFGFTSGGSDYHGKHQKDNSPNAFGGGAGAGVNIIPVAFLVVNGDTVKVLNVQPPESSLVEKAVEAAPEIIDKIGDFIREHKKPKAGKDGEAAANPAAEE